MSVTDNPERTKALRELNTMLDACIRAECDPCTETNRENCKVCTRVLTFKTSQRILRGGERARKLRESDALFRRMLVVCDDLVNETDDHIKSENAKAVKVLIKKAMIRE